MTEEIDRRRFLKVLGVTGAGAATLSACGIGPEPTEKLIPYLIQPEDQIPGIATFYASTCRECSAGCGIHVRVREGRAVKIEGNPDSPLNRGRLCSRGQAALQGLYNPDRVRGPLVRNAAGSFEPIAWDDAISRLQTTITAAARGRAIVFLSGAEASSFGDLVDAWMAQLGGRRVGYEPFAFEALRTGNRIAFGTSAVPWYDFANARSIIAFGADFLDTWLSPVAFQNGFSAAHAFDAARAASKARFVYVGPRLSLTGMNADEWIAALPGTEGLLALAMAQVIVSQRLAPALSASDTARLGDLLERHRPAAVAPAIGIDAAVIGRLARDFAAEARAGGGRGLAVAGGMAAHYANGAEIVAAVNVLNYVAGAVGTLVNFDAELPPSATAGAFRDITALTADMAAGRLASGVLLIHGANPGHSLPGSFTQALGRVGFKVSFSSYMDETAAACDMILPDHHPLEQWADSRPRAGVYALQQPVVQPVFDTRHTGELVLRLAERPGTFRDYLQDRWRDVQRRARGGAGQSFEQFWAEAVQHGGVYDVAPAAPARPAQRVRLAETVASIVVGVPPATPGQAEEHTVVVFPHPILHDGRGANKPWLQELPDPVSKIAWHGWVEVHPDTAARWGVATGDFLRIQSTFGGVLAPVWITRAVRPDVLALPTGQGHTAYGRYAKDRSFNAFELLGTEPNAYGGRSFVVRARVSKTGEHRRMASTEGSPRERGEGSVELLPLARARALRAGDHPFHHEETPEYAAAAVAWWAERQFEKAELGDYAGEQPRWGMAIDLSKCTGCSACVTACYAENNIATAGEELVSRGREMSWLRIERYWLTEDDGTPQGAVSSPMLCQHCGNAPCEPVCPVYAAYHTPDGLNGQVYNRCVGTRYCANNCPYKVRYFNWFNFAEAGGAWDAWPEPLPMLLNPDVTVREKGVMEKCTFCVQRIRGAQNQARLADRTVRDGEIVPACAQTCPSEAIAFGDLNDRNSQVFRLAGDPRGYHVLAGLNTKPAITYLAHVTDGAAAHG
ncbi:MAG: molybdopterin-dependent oxidoreductase [Gemmatimonadales bacterium]